MLFFYNKIRTPIAVADAARAGDINRVTAWFAADRAQSGPSPHHCARTCVSFNDDHVLLLRLDTRGLDDRLPLLRFRFDVGREFFRRAGDHFHALSDNALLNFSATQGA